MMCGNSWRWVDRTHKQKMGHSGCIRPNKYRKLLFCLDYCRLNLATIAETYPLPRLDECIDRFRDPSVFTTLDANSGYWKIPISGRDHDKTCFTMHGGKYRYKRIPFALRNAPETFQRTLYIILRGVRWKRCLVHLD